MICFKLFLAFFVIGAVSFGGGYGMISIVRDTVLANGWLTETEFVNFIAVSESTPGPLAVNMATFIGSSQAGFLGALVSTLGVILPAFIIILLISIALKDLLKHPAVTAVLEAVRPCTVALVLSTALILALDTLLPAGSLDASLDLKGLAVFAILALTHLACRLLHHTSPNPIFMILLSALLGILFWGIW